MNDDGRPENFRFQVLVGVLISIVMASAYLLATRDETTPVEAEPAESAPAAPPAALPTQALPPALPEPPVPPTDP